MSAPNFNTVNYYSIDMWHFSIKIKAKIDNLYQDVTQLKNWQETPEKPDIQYNYIIHNTIYICTITWHKQQKALGSCPNTRGVQKTKSLFGFGFFFGFGFLKTELNHQ